MIGQTISHYRIVGKLGEGGMGVVYKAEDILLKRTVALKFLPPELTRDPDATKRFMREAQAASSLDHPNICTIHDIAETKEKQIFIVMACYEGESLKNQIEQGPFKFDQAITIAVQIASGLAEAHKHGIVHRDIKPANITTTIDGAVKIVDFGLAKLTGAQTTRTSGTAGTVAYMSPEQLRGDEADHRADVFSFGVLLYEMLTGHLPFRGDHAPALMYAITNEPPLPLDSHIPQVSSRLGHIINRALEKDANDRYQAMTDVLTDLQRLQEDTAGTASEAYPILQTEFFANKKAAVIGFSLLLAAGAIALLLIAQPGNIPRLNPNRTQRIVQVPVQHMDYFAISPDGNWIAFGGKDAKGMWDVYFMNSMGGDVRRVTRDSGDWRIDVRDISPDGSWILYSRERLYRSEIALVPSLGGPSVYVCDGFMPRFAQGGERIFYFAGTAEDPGESGVYQVWSVKRDGTDNHRVFSDSGLSRASFGGISVSHSPSPDGRSIVWIKTDSAYGQNIFSYDISSQTTAQLTFGHGLMDEVSWTHNNFIIYSQYTRSSGNYDLWMFSPEGGDQVQLTQSTTTDEVYGDLSNEGKMLLYFEYQLSGNIRIMNLETGEITQVTSDDRNRLGASMSPNNRFVSYTPLPSYSPYNTRLGIQVIDRTGATSQQYFVSEDVIWPTRTSWAPHGDNIAYVRMPARIGQKYAVCIVSPWSSGRSEVIAEMEIASGGTDPYLRWGDPQTLMWFNNMKTWMISLENPAAKQFYQDSVDAYPFQNRKYILFRDYREGRKGWWIDNSMSLTENNRPRGRRILGPVNAAISPQGEFLLYFSTSGDLMKMKLPEGKEQRLPYRIERHYWSGYPELSIAYDGKSIVYIETVSHSKLVIWEDPFIWK